jgi:hypothetical protein
VVSSSATSAVVTPGLVRRAGRGSSILAGNCRMPLVPSRPGGGVLPGVFTDTK